MGNTLEGTSVDIDVVIIGCGPTGLGAAYRLHQHDQNSWFLIDAEKQPGGLVGSVKTAQGFRFDHGFKTLRKRYDYFDTVFKKHFSSESSCLLRQCEDSSHTFICGRLVKCPVQDNLNKLPTSDRDSCVIDLVKAKLAASDQVNPCDPKNLDEYLVSEWGETLSNLFFRPYLYKSWAYSTAKLSFDWFASKILPIDFGKKFNKIIGKEYNDDGNSFDYPSFYPRSGGLLGIWRSLSKVLPSQNIRFQNEIEELDIEAKILKTKSGLEIRYKQLLSTMPLNVLLDMCGRNDLSSCLFHSSLFIVCIGIRGIPHFPNIKGCVYFPEADTIFHRASVASNYDPDGVPKETKQLPTIRLAGSDKVDDNTTEKPGPYWSLMLEISEGPHKIIDESTVVDQAIRDALDVGFLKNDDEIVSLHLTQMTYDRPLPTTDTKQKVEEALQWLRSKDVWSRGRFGCFKYELGDIDQCFIQGVEAVDNILQDTPERCYLGQNEDDSYSVHQFPIYEVQPQDVASTESSTSNKSIDDVTFTLSESDSGDDVVTSEPSNCE